jgi:hypothetical protein
MITEDDLRSCFSALPKGARPSKRSNPSPLSCKWDSQLDQILVSS